MAASALIAAVPPDLRDEVALSAEDFKKLDTFEGVLLSKADKAYAAREFRRAAAEYDAFVLQYPKSVAIPYALLRKGRAIQRDNKRNEAIKVYGEILDYFPNAISYAGAALFYTGECHWQNGDVKEAMKAWAEMAQDQDYRKHTLAAGAINQLADNLARQDKWQEALAYYQQVAVDFRRVNLDAARYAMDRVTYGLVRKNPDEPKLRAAYEKVGTFEDVPRAPDETNYWVRVMESVDRLGTFGDTEKDEAVTYYHYWAGVMEGKHPAWDDFQIKLARYHLASDGDASKWMERMDAQYARYQTDGNHARTIKWIRTYGGRKAKVDEYYARLSFEKMSNGLITDLIRVLYDSGTDAALARNTIAKLKADQMTDNERESLARWIWNRDEEGLRQVVASMKDQDRANMLLVRYYRETRQPDKGLKIVDDSTRVPAYAKEAFMAKGEFFQWKRQWTDAIAAYRSADCPPESIFKIAECLFSDGKRDQAVVQLREIENFFEKAAPEAAMRIAYMYRDTRDTKQYVASLRGIMKKYPASGQSSTAHQELERMGIKTGGGVDAD